MTRSVRPRGTKLFWTTSLVALVASRKQPRETVLRDEVPKELTALVEALLRLGGHTVVIPFDSIDMTPLILSRANRAPPPPERIRVTRGRTSACHENAAKLWKKSPKGTQLVTGYALSADGLWRRHSWVLTGETVIETTERRARYFGFSLRAAEAKRFHEVYCE